MDRVVITNPSPTQQQSRSNAHQRGDEYRAEGTGVLMSRLTNWLRSRRVPPKARVQPPTEYLGRHRLAPQLVCEVDAGQAAREAMFDHIAKCWSQLGETEPHWSVLTNPKYF